MSVLTLNPRFNHFFVSDLSVVSNDGIPSAVFFEPPVLCSSPTKNETAVLVDPPCRPRRSSSIGGLSDDALDLFPATQEEEEELREVESYVEMLAWLEFVEETHGSYPSFSQLQKRWSERRKDPIVPRPSSGRNVKVHHASGNSNLNVRDIIRGMRMPIKSSFDGNMQAYGGKGKGDRKRRMGKQFASKNRVYQPMK
eukprot:CAMPEP_0118644636 /NCGR_PEP_ID=MMETSP0785-20121206/7054_1 /TAXON_ID=91992 /ORGANISM="Bolidomonas pacifica, Strain CCMP 1866" /LENGTH=196 /DNA_ID=CAMNT_0006536427 /DNA_START=213 /DNA_END=803 /DNA_ORIENTATION=-